MVEKNLKRLKAKKRRVMNGFNTGTRDMKLKTAYQRNSDITDYRTVLYQIMVAISSAKYSFPKSWFAACSPFIS